MSLRGSCCTKSSRDRGSLTAAKVELCITACFLVPSIWWRKRRPACCLRKRNCELNRQVVFEVTPGCDSPCTAHQSAAADVPSQWSHREQLLLCLAVTFHFAKRESCLWGSLPDLSSGEANMWFWKVEQLHAGMSNHLHWEWNFSDPKLCTLTQELSLMFAEGCCSLSCSETFADRSSSLLDSRWGWPTGWGNLGS